MLSNMIAASLGESQVLISDIEPFHATFMAYLLKIWCDRYSLNDDVKDAMFKITVPKKNIYIYILI